MQPPEDPGAGIGILTNPTLAALPGLRHGFTTRAFGSCERGGDIARRALPGEAGWTVHDLHQVHGTEVHEVPPAAESAGDGLVTRAARSLLVVRTADCVPVLLAAVHGAEVVAVAAAHAGWRGLVAGILPRGVAGLARLAPSARVLAAIGPCIGPCCFEVGPDVAGPLRARFGDIARPGEGDRSFADLPAAVRSELRSLGAETDEHQPPCTKCSAALFFSHRREGAAAGRMASFIGRAP